MRKDMTLQKPILVIGAGLSGLTLARLLVRRNIPVIVFDQSPPDRSQGYGITLRDWAFVPLLEGLIPSRSVQELQQAVATDRSIGGTGRVDLTFRNNGTGETLFNPDPRQPDQAGTLFRANRSALRNWLAEEVDVRYEHKLVKLDGSLGNVRAVFENGLIQEGLMLVAADGVHSTVRSIMLPHVEAEVLPIVLFHGKRYMTREDYVATGTKPALGTSNVVAGVGDSFNTFITIADANGDGIHLDWSYSRAVQGDKDPLWMPDRGEIIKVPQHLLKEIRSRDLVPPFSTLVNADSIKKDKVFNWRIRSVHISRADLDQSLHQGVIFIGDAVHAMPIFGGEGGNHAILDGVELFKQLMWRYEKRAYDQFVVDDLKSIGRAFYDSAAPRGQDAVRRCIQRFAGFHKPIDEWQNIAIMAEMRVGTNS